MYLFANSRNGVSALELPLEGEVEADETYIGWRTYQGKRGRGVPNKVIVFAMAQRSGPIVAKVVPNVRMRTLQPVIA